MKRIYSALIGIISVFLFMASMDYSHKHAPEAEEIKPQEGEVYLSYQEVKIHPWKKEGDWYFFLPSYFDWSQAKLNVFYGDLQIDGETVASASFRGGAKL